MLAMPFQTPLKTSLMPFQAFSQAAVKVLVMKSIIPWKKDFTVLMPAPIKLLKDSHSDFRVTTIAIHAALTALHTVCATTFTLSQCVMSRTRTAISAPIAITTNPIGLVKTEKTVCTPRITACNPDAIPLKIVKPLPRIVRAPSTMPHAATSESTTVINACVNSSCWDIQSATVLRPSAIACRTATIAVPIVEAIGAITLS